MWWFNYVVSFSTGLQKVGITRHPFRRLQEALLEAQRNGAIVNGFHVTPPSASKAIASKVKKTTCDHYRDIAVLGHRNWFANPLAVQAQMPRNAIPSLFSCLKYFVNGQWHMSYPSADAIAITKRWSDYTNLAADLGSFGRFIKPALASALGVALVHKYEEECAKRVVQASPTQVVRRTEVRLAKRRYYCNAVVA